MAEQASRTNPRLTLAVAKGPGTIGASDVISAVRPELDGRTPAAVKSILREQLNQFSVEVSDSELQRVATDIATAGLARVLATAG
ncbi:hypothetical protein [Microterricola viridarii]|nr:hypothetical protein [Microterricola viridarii]